MIYRFEHEIQLPPVQYANAVTAYADPEITDADYIELKPKVVDTKSGKIRIAGSLSLISANTDDFAGCWLIDDDGDKKSNIAYETMLLQLGLPQSTEYYSYAFSQHLVGGKRIDEKSFAVTSLFHVTSRNSRGRPPTEKSIESERKALEAFYGITRQEIPSINSFTQADIAKAAKSIRLKKPLVSKRKRY